jgi:hypothetical protein
MSEERVFVIGDDDKVSSATTTGSITGFEARTLTEIIRLIDDPIGDVSVITRMIAREIAIVNEQLSQVQADPNQTWRLRPLVEQIKALRELSKTLQEGDALSKKDVLNFDGPKFQYVLREITIILKESVKEAGMDDDAVIAVLKAFRSLMATRESSLRTEVNRLDSAAFTRNEV